LISQIEFYFDTPKRLELANERPYDEFTGSYDALGGADNGVAIPTMVWRCPSSGLKKARRLGDSVN